MIWFVFQALRGFLGNSWEDGDMLTALLAYAKNRLTWRSRGRRIRPGCPPPWTGELPQVPTRAVGGSLVAQRLLGLRLQPRHQGLLQLGGTTQCAGIRGERCCDNLGDTLSAITPSGSNRWTPAVLSPRRGACRASAAACRSLPTRSGFTPAGGTFRRPSSPANGSALLQAPRRGSIRSSPAANRVPCCQQLGDVPLGQLGRIRHGRNRVALRPHDVRPRLQRD